MLSALTASLMIEGHESMDIWEGTLEAGHIQFREARVLVQTCFTGKASMFQQDNNKPHTASVTAFPVVYRRLLKDGTLQRVKQVAMTTVFRCVAAINFKMT